MLLFQTLIGTVKRGIGPEITGGVRVSNPYRYGQKPILGVWGGRGPRVFQTLIGTVKSVVPYTAFPPFFHRFKPL